MNLGEGVTTINSLLHYFDTASLVDQYTLGRLQASLRKLRRAGLRRIVLDEMSMLSGDQLTVLARAIAEVNGEPIQAYDINWETDEEEEADAPPLAITLCGDWCQLPPVKEPFAFESPEWPRFEHSVLRLTKIHRQDDPDFIAGLAAARRAETSTVLSTFGPLCSAKTDLDFEGTTVVATNAAVDRINLLRIDRLRGEADRYPTLRWGEQRPEWGKNIPEILGLKPGCLVMVLANSFIAEEDRYEYVNGDLGVYEGRDKDAPTVAVVSLYRGGETVRVRPVTREVTEPLEPGERKQLRAEGKAAQIRDKAKVTGAITYLPLRVAYATTVFKVQGLTLDQVQVNITEHFFGNPGSLYVALSRARTLAGLRIVGTPGLLQKRCTIDRRVKDWL